MNVDWGWIKQRPHFLAETLSLENDVIVLYPYAWRRTHITKNKKNGLKVAPFFSIPFSATISTLRKINIIFLYYMKILEIILIIGIILIIFYFFNKRELFSIENVLDQNTNYDLLYNPKYDPDGTSNSSQLNLSNNLSNNLDYKSNRKLDLPSNYDPKYDAPNNQTAIDFPMNNNPINFLI
jgi:hypothetical protein